MKNFDVRIATKAIINGVPLATCEVTLNNVTVAVVKYDYFSGVPNVIFLNASPCMRHEEATDSNIERFSNRVKFSVLQHISSEVLSQANHVCF